MVAGCWIVGTVIGSIGKWGDVHIVAATLATGFVLWHTTRQRWRAARCWGVLALIGLAAAWADVRMYRVSADHISQWITPQPQLTQLTGVVDSQPVTRDGEMGAFSRFTRSSPVTSFALNVKQVQVGSSSQSASGLLQVYLAEEDHRIQRGDVLRLQGWLSLFREPANPGERDLKAAMAAGGIAGRVSLPHRENWRLVNRPSYTVVVGRLRQSMAQVALNSLRVGLKGDPTRVAFLETILLGQWRGGLGDLTDSFRRVGLAHLLSISGAHLGILLGWVWILGRLIGLFPPRAAALVLVVLGLYLLAVPLRVPVVRAGVMAGFVCLGYAGGRPVRSLDLLAASAVALLIVNPADLFTPGFQLSFGVVAGLLLFTTPTSQRLWPDPPIIVDADRGRVRLIRTAVNFVAAHLVAFAIAGPLVAYHFGMVSPMTCLLSFLAYPWVTLVLGVGYLKIALGVVWPSVGAVLAGPLAFFADGVTGLVRHAESWPGVVVALPVKPSGAWVVGALAVIVAVLHGWFAKRRVAMGMALVVCGLWLIGAGWGKAWQVPVGNPSADTSIRLNMLAVGEGSCYIVRLGDESSGKGGGHSHVLMFDCGTRGYGRVGADIVVPALGRLGVRSIDTLVISHPDLDHFNGVLDVVDRVPVGRVWVSPQFLAEARRVSDGAAAFLVQELATRRLTPEVVSRGWLESRGHGVLKVLWPPADLRMNRPTRHLWCYPLAMEQVEKGVVAWGYPKPGDGSVDGER